MIPALRSIPHSGGTVWRTVTVTTDRRRSATSRKRWTRRRRAGIDVTLRRGRLGPCRSGEAGGQKAGEPAHPRRSSKRFSLNVSRGSGPRRRNLHSSSCCSKAAVAEPSVFIVITMLDYLDVRAVPRRWINGSLYLIPHAPRSDGGRHRRPAVAAGSGAGAGAATALNDVGEIRPVAGSSAPLRTWLN